jgi:ankyrin repeat protein
VTGKRARKKAIIAAAADGDLDAVQGWLEEDPDLVHAATSHGNSACARAVEGGHREVVELFLARGADPQQRNDGGWSLLDRAAEGGHREVARLLVEHGCEPEVRHRVAMDDAEWLRVALRDDPRLARAGPVDSRGYGLLHAAAAADARECATALLDAGADVNRSARHYRHRPLSTCARKPVGERLAMAELLLDRGANPDVPAGHSGGSVLLHAIHLRDHDLAKLLLERGADLDARACGNRTALYAAIATGTQGLVRLVLRYGPDLTVRSKVGWFGRGGETPLEYARRRKLDKIEAMLREAGAK